jgi:RNA polymerase sigma factor (sigma-70 family)
MTDSNNYDDYFQTGCIGLINAVDNFDTECGKEFSTFAVTAIWYTINYMIARPKKMQKRTAQIVYIDEPLTDDSKCTLADIISDNSDDFINIENRIDIHNALSKLDDETRNTICMFAHGANQNEISAYIDKSSRTVRRRIKNGLNSMRASLSAV